MRLITLSILFLLFACKHSPYEPCGADQVTYRSDIKPIISARCATQGCHGANSPVGDFTTYTGLNRVCNNNLFEKRVFVRKDMPPSALTECELIILKKWYRQGHTSN